MTQEDQKHLKELQEKIKSGNLSESEIAYYNRILRVTSMPDLTQIPGNPVNMIVEKLKNSDFYKGFDIYFSPEIVKEFETFDLFYFAEDHVARRPSDSYFLEKTSEKDKNLLLRPHTTIMWYHYLLNGGGLEKLRQDGKIEVLSYGKTYRVDELDKTHHECFHQIDGLKIALKGKEIINQDTLKDVLSHTIKSIFGEQIEYRFNVDSFPYTTDSLEVEVKNGDERLEVLGAGVVKGEVLEKLGVDSAKYNGWAFGFGIERLTMALKKIPDIRIFWSQDKRILSQWGNFEPYKEISQFPPVYKDISMIVPKEKFIIDESEKDEIKLSRETESSFFAITGIIRDIGDPLIEEVKIIDNYEFDKKFGNDKKSITINITFRAIDRTLTNEEINKIYFEIRENVTNELAYELR